MQWFLANSRQVNHVMPSPNYNPCYKNTEYTLQLQQEVGVVQTKFDLNIIGWSKQNNLYTDMRPPT